MTTRKPKPRIVSGIGRGSDEWRRTNAAATRAKQEALGVTRYRWRTCQDERVRPEHRRRNGTVLAWASPPEGGHPGEDEGCRCIAEAMMDHLLGD